MGWLRNALCAMINLNDDQRQTMTTWSMLGGAIASTGVIAGLIYIMRYSWPDAIIQLHAALIIGGLFNVIYGFMGLVGIMVIAQAVIAIGGKMKASFGGASLEAEAEKRDHN
jgi:hypothetical protein